MESQRQQQMQQQSQASTPDNLVEDESDEDQPAPDGTLIVSVPPRPL